VDGLPRHCYVVSNLECCYAVARGFRLVARVLLHSFMVSKALLWGVLTSKVFWVPSMCICVFFSGP